MEQWGFVFLAYGIVWCVVVLYITVLKRRLRKTETELTLHGGSSDPHHKEK